MGVRVARRHVDALAGDDRTVPVPRWHREASDPLAAARVVDVERAVRVIDPEQSAGNHGTGARRRLRPDPVEPVVGELVGRSARARGDEDAGPTGPVQYGG